MRGGLVVCVRIVCDAMRQIQSFYEASGFSAGWLHSRGALRCTGCDAMRCDARDAMREPMRCELIAMQCAALRCTVRGLFAMQCAARGLVAFARCRRRHAFDGGIFRVGWVGGVVRCMRYGRCVRCMRYGRIGGRAGKRKLFF